MKIKEHNNNLLVWHQGPNARYNTSNLFLRKSSCYRYYSDVTKYILVGTNRKRVLNGYK